MSSKAYRAVLKLRAVKEPTEDEQNPIKLIQPTVVGDAELAPTGAVGSVYQKLASGFRWIDQLDGGNASGVVSYPGAGYVPGAVVTPDSWTLGQTNFTFATETYTPSANFSF